MEVMCELGGLYGKEIVVLLLFFCHVNCLGSFVSVSLVFFSIRYQLLNISLILQSIGPEHGGNIIYVREWATSGSCNS